MRPYTIVDSDGNRFGWRVWVIGYEAAVLVEEELVFTIADKSGASH